MHQLIKAGLFMSLFTLTACGAGAGALTAVAAPFGAMASTQQLGRFALDNKTDTTSSELARSADAFVNSVGVNVHLFYTNTPYVTNYSAVRSHLAALHMRHLRDGLSNTNWQPYYDHLNDLATLGIHDDLITQVGESMSVVTAYPARLPHAMESIEGPNEYNDSGNAHWASDLRAFQQQLYTTVKESAATSSLPVVGPSFTSYQACMAIGGLSGMSDDGNMHDYFSFRNPGTPGWGSDFAPYGVYGSLPYNIGIVRHVYDPRPIMATETGWDDGATYGKTASSVSAAVKARYTMRVLLEHFNANISRTYLYELLDEGGQNFGLLDGKLTPKPAYTALLNLLSKLNDPGPPNKTTALTYTLSADPSVHHTLLQKRDGSYHLLLWIETPATDTLVQVKTVTLNLASKFTSIVQYAWQDNGTYTTTNLSQAANKQLVVHVTDRVTDLKLQQ